MKILIISEYIAPIQAVASIRWSKISKYLKKDFPDVLIDVLTNFKDNTVKRDTLLEKETKHFGNYWEISPSILFKVYLKIKEVYHKNQGKRDGQIGSDGLVVSKKKRFLTAVVHDIKDVISFFQINGGLKKLHFSYDVIISTYGPMLTHLVAEKIKKRSPQAIWIADFRDPYAKDVEPSLIYKFHKTVTMKHCNAADYIIRVTDDLETFTPPQISRYMIPNGYDPEEKLDPLPPPKFSIVFTGVLYGDRRDIGIVCKAISELRDEGKINEKDIEVSYAGPDGELAKGLAEIYQAERWLHDYGVVPRQDALKMQQTAAILLQMNWNTEKEKCFWSGKMYEYMMAEKPIIYVVTGDAPYSEPSKYIDRLGGYCYEQCRHEETYQGMKDYILEKYQEWKATGNVTVQQDKEYVEQFAYPHIAEQVWQLIQEGMRKRNESGIIKEN